MYTYPTTYTTTIGRKSTVICSNVAHIKTRALSEYCSVDAVVYYIDIGFYCAMLMLMILSRQKNILPLLRSKQRQKYLSEGEKNSAFTEDINRISRGNTIKNSQPKRLKLVLDSQCVGKRYWLMKRSLLLE